MDDSHKNNTEAKDNQDEAIAIRIVFNPYHDRHAINNIRMRLETDTTKTDEWQGCSGSIMNRTHYSDRRAQSERVTTERE